MWNTYTIESWDGSQWQHVTETKTRGYVSALNKAHADHGYTKPLRVLDDCGTVLCDEKDEQRIIEEARARQEKK